MKNESTLLILGVPRSGTTLLSTLVGAHPRVAMLNEDRSGAIRNLVSKKIVGNKLCIPNQIDFSSPFLARIARRYGFTFYRDQSVVSLREYLRNDDLKLVIILRDPRASIDSMMERGDNSFPKAARRWKRGTEMAHRLYSQESGRLLLVDFEELVQESEQTLRGISDFLGISYEPCMLDGWRGHKYSDRGGIKAEKAKAGEKADLPMDIQTQFPETHDIYLTLRERSFSPEPELR